MAAGRRRHLPGDVLRRHLARPRGLPAARRRRRAAVASGARGTTRSRTRSSPATSRRAPSSRSAPTSTSSSGSRASARSGCTSRSAAAPARSSGCASTTTWPTTAARRPASSRRWPTRPPATYPPAATYPEPVEHCDVCRWAAECVARRRADDHLSLVAGISARQRRALIERGVPTLEALGDLRAPDGAKARGHERGGARARPRAGPDPARGPADRPNRFELLLPEPGEPIEPERGLASLPPPSPGDLFLDIEGDPYALDDGLDYLFGVLETDGTFHAFWSRDETGEFTLAGEKAALRAASWTSSRDRLRADPDLHIYHYAPYEPTALKRLMGRYGTREDEVDDLLRRGDPRRPAAGRPPVAAGVGRELLDQEDGGVLRVRARDRPARRRVEHRRVRGVARARRGRAPGRRPPRADRALQPRRRREQPAAPRLARGAPRSSSRSETGLEVPATGDRGPTRARRT